MYLTMSEPADIVVYSPDKELRLVVEVKGKQGASPEWAAQMRRNLLTHSAVPRAPFFLLALPDRLYLWKNGSEISDARPADFVVDSSQIILPYLDDPSISTSNRNWHGLELIIASWLNLLTISQLSEAGAAPHEKWLLESGLYDAIKNGSVETEASS
jgi:hypothetical protein